MNRRDLSLTIGIIFVYSRGFQAGIGHYNQYESERR